MVTEEELIAYYDLKERILDLGLCTLCGACEAACPVNALNIKEGELQYIADCSQYLDFCPICYDICPHTKPLLVEALSFVTDAPYRRESLGCYRKIILAQAVDPKLRELSHSGGVVTALLMNSMQKGFIDSVVASEAEEEVSIRLRPSLSLVVDDIPSAVDAAHHPSAVATAFQRAVHEFGKTKIAFVGTPCQVLALRKLESWEHKIMDSLKFVIGLMELWSFFFPSLLEGIGETHGVEPSEIQKISLDKDYVIHLKDRTVTIPTAEIKEHILEGCLTCWDYTSLLADISVGGAHPLEDWSIVIVRTEVGEEQFDDAVESGVIQVRDLEGEPKVFTHLLEMANFKRKAALEEIEKIRAAGKPVPPATKRLLQLVPKELSLLSSLKVEQIMTEDVITISPDTTMEELLNIMTKHHHMGYPILDENQQLVGIATFQDIMDFPPQKRSTAKVRDIKKKKLITAYPDDTVLTTYEKMTEHGIGRVPVVDPEKPQKLLGIVTRTDIMQTLRWPMKRK